MKILKKFVVNNVKPVKQQKYVVKILRKFVMNNVKPVKSLWISIASSLQVYVLIDEEEKGYMSRVL